MTTLPSFHLFIEILRYFPHVSKESVFSPTATPQLNSPAEGSRRAMRAAYQAPSLSTRLKEPNPEELFLLSLAPMLQSLEPEKLSEAKIQIMSVIHRAQFN